MANSLTIEHCYLDTFTNAIDFKDYFPSGFRVISIEWTRPQSLEDTCEIKINGADSENLIEWECAVVGERRINFYEGRHYENLYIDANGVTSGVVIIDGK
ncbi:MAG: hypothetical protein GY774_35675 [Planctomycetes bacterium]|nr:hypothetical protein [Planctomycetota bacterium]